MARHLCDTCQSTLVKTMMPKIDPNRWWRSCDLVSQSRHDRGSAFLTDRALHDMG